MRNRGFNILKRFFSGKLNTQVSVQSNIVPPPSSATELDMSQSVNSQYVILF